MATGIEISFFLGNNVVRYVKVFESVKVGIISRLTVQKQYVILLAVKLVLTYAHFTVNQRNLDGCFIMLATHTNVL